MTLHLLERRLADVHDRQSVAVVGLDLLALCRRRGRRRDRAHRAAPRVPRFGGGGRRSRRAGRSDDVGGTAEGPSTRGAVDVAGSCEERLCSHWESASSASGQTVGAISGGLPL